jgi:hypothetical protein
MTMSLDANAAATTVKFAREIIRTHEAAWEAQRALEAADEMSGVIEERAVTAGVDRTDLLYLLNEWHAGKDDLEALAATL